MQVSFVFGKVAASVYLVSFLLCSFIVEFRGGEGELALHLS